MLALRQISATNVRRNLARLHSPSLLAQQATRKSGLDAGSEGSDQRRNIKAMSTKRELNDTEREIRKVCPGYYEDGPYTAEERRRQAHIHALIDAEEKLVIESLVLNFDSEAV